MCATANVRRVRSSDGAGTERRAASGRSRPTLSAQRVGVALTANERRVRFIIVYQSEYSIKSSFMIELFGKNWLRVFIF